MHGPIPQWIVDYEDRASRKHTALLLMGLCRFRSSVLNLAGRDVMSLVVSQVMSAPLRGESMSFLETVAQPPAKKKRKK